MTLTKLLGSGGTAVKFIVVISDTGADMSDGDYVAAQLRDLADRLDGVTLSDELLALPDGDGNTTVGYAGLMEGLA